MKLWRFKGEVRRILKKKEQQTFANLPVNDRDVQSNLILAIYGII